MYLYLGLHIFTISFPLARSFEPKVQFARRWKHMWPGMLVTAAFFLVWDYFFTRAGVWGFNPRYLIGVEIAGMPIEEWLFFFTVPFACMFIYACVIVFFPRLQGHKTARFLVLTLAIALIVIALMNYERAYTFYNFLFTGFFLLFLYGKNPGYLPQFLLAMGFVMIPFFIVNGVLTGSFIDEEIVWYNNKENLGLRLGTIPVEDPFYALLLVGMNVFGYEWLRKKDTNNGL